MVTLGFKLSQSHVLSVSVGQVCEGLDFSGVHWVLNVFLMFEKRSPCMAGHDQGNLDSTSEPAWPVCFSPVRGPCAQLQHVDASVLLAFDQYDKEGPHGHFCDMISHMFLHVSISRLSTSQTLLPCQAFSTYDIR